MRKSSDLFSIEMMVMMDVMMNVEVNRRGGFLLMCEWRVLVIRVSVEEGLWRGGKDERRGFNVIALSEAIAIFLAEVEVRRRQTRRAFAFLFFFVLLS